MHVKNSGWTFSFSQSLCFMPFAFSFFTLKPAEGDYQVVGSLLPVVAVVGSDVVLPCYVEPEFNTVDLTVEWSDPDLKPDPNDRLRRVNYVHLYRDNREVLDMKDPSYRGRTALFSDGLSRGNVSLKITNVTFADGGRYKCFIPKLKSQKPFSIMHLTVVIAESGTKETPRPPLSLQTPYSTEGMHTRDVLAHRSRLIPLVVSCIFFICVGGCLFVALVLKCRGS